MDLITLAVSTLVSGVIVTILQFITKNMLKKQFDAQNELQSFREKQRKEEIENTIKNELQPLRSDLDLLKNGSQASLRNDLLTKYKECSEVGYRTIRDTQDGEDMYIAYHNLGGNSFIDQTKVDFEGIPTEEKYRVIHKDDDKGE